MPSIKRTLIGGIDELLGGSDRAIFTKLAKAISGNEGFKGLSEARAMVNQILHATDAAPLTIDKLETYRAIRELIDEASERAVKYAPKAQELLEIARRDYRPFKELENSKFMKAVVKEGASEEDILNALLKADKSVSESGLDLAGILERVGERDRALMENAIIKSVLNRFTKEGVTDFKAVSETLNTLPLKTAQAVDITSNLKQSAGVLNNTGYLLNEMKGMRAKSPELHQGMSQKAGGRFKTMFANRIVNRIKSVIPYVGNDQALKNHITNALKRAGGDLSVAAKNIRDIPSANTPSATRRALDEFADFLDAQKTTFNDKRATIIRKGDLARVQTALKYEKGGAIYAKTGSFS